MTGPDPIQGAGRDACDAGYLDGWHVTDEADGFWSRYEPHDVKWRDVGFKIHVSASISSAGEVLARTIPILTQMRIPFKHSARLEHLMFLSGGGGGISQVGKFLTAYPPDPETARELALALHQATDGLHGPQIPSDVPLFADSLVHYRYGGFTQQWLQLPTGRIALARMGVDGLEVDDRDALMPVPPGIEGPFVHNLEARSRLDTQVLRGRYIRVKQLHRGPKGSTWLGFTDGGLEHDLVIIKEAYAYVMEGSDGLDAGQRLRREAESLRRLRSTGVTPVLEEYWEEKRSSFLVYRLVEGPTFASVLHALADEGLRPPCDLVRQWTQALCNAVHSLHQIGYVIGDIKPANLVFTGEAFHFIDLELAGPPTTEPAGSMGTYGYRSPQQQDPNCGRSFLDDVYALGATILAAATLTDASMLPDRLSVARLESGRDPGNPIYSAIERCLAPERDKRFASVAEVSEHVDERRPPTNIDSNACSNKNPADFMQLACLVGDSLLRDATRDGSHAYWISHHPTVGGHPGRDLYAGSSGTGLFLCALYAVTNEFRYLDTALQCGRWLWETEPSVPRQIDMPGLYFGDCGPGLLYLKLYLCTDDSVWLRRAASVGETVCRMVRHSPDVMTGAAGTGIFQLALWHASGDESALDRAFDEAHALMEMREKTRPTWIIPPGHEGLSGDEYIGFSHGSAGIGYFFAECCLARRDMELERACSEIADWIIGLGQQCLHDGRGLTWAPTPYSVHGQGAYWCRGSAGIARFLLTAYEVSANISHLRAAEGAGRMVADGASWNGTTQCHGLAGNAEVIVDIWQHFQTDDWLMAARLLGENLAAYQTEKGWPSESHLVLSPDLMVGQAGVGAAFLRLGMPQLRHLISSEAFAARGAVARMDI